MRYVLLILLWPLAVTAAHATEALASKNPVASHANAQAPAAAVHGSAQKKAPAADSDAVWVRLSRQATLRDGPSVHARILANVDLGSEVKVMWRRRDGWVEIRIAASSQVGWTREKNLPLAPVGTEPDESHAAATATASDTSEKPPQAHRKHSRVASGRKHRKNWASTQRRPNFAERAAPGWPWRRADAHFRTYGYRYY
jgi:uncharacterized protein YgiM (DUF1202 family)